MAVSKKLADLKKSFVGISEFRFCTTSADFNENTVWDYELPILRDSLNFEVSEPSFDNKYIHGESVPYVSTAEPGETTMSFEIPSIDDDITGWLLTKSESSAVVGVADTVGDVAGTWKGAGYKLDNKVIKGMAMIISEDRTKAILIRNLKGYVSVNMSELSNSPVSFTISATIESSISDSKQGDIMFLEFTKN